MNTVATITARQIAEEMSISELRAIANEIRADADVFNDEDIAQLFEYIADLRTSLAAQFKEGA